MIYGVSEEIQNHYITAIAKARGWGDKEKDNSRLLLMLNKKRIKEI
jgi:hypothetical protein